MEDDRLLLEQVHADRKNFGLVFDKYYKPVFLYIFRRSGDYDLARDVSAETFLKAFLHIEKFQWKNIPLSSWLFRIATNELNMYFRKKEYMPVYLSQLAEQHVEITDGQTTEQEKVELEQKLKEHEEFVLISKKLKELHVKYQEVIALRYFEEKSIREISEILDKKEGTVKSLLSRGLEKLKLLVQPN